MVRITLKCASSRPKSLLSAQAGIVVGRHAFAVGDGLSVLDISDSAAPLIVGRHQTGLTRDVDVEGSLAFLASPEAGLQIVDVRDASNPALVSTYRPSIGEVQEVDVLEKHAYCGVAKFGEPPHYALEVIDVTDSARPVLRGGLLLNGAPQDLQVVKTFAYVIGVDLLFHGLEIIDVGNPANPQRVGVYKHTPKVSGSIFVDVPVSGTYAYLATWLEDVVVIDVSDPANPRRVGAFRPPGRMGALQAVGNLLYVAYNLYPREGFGLQVLDVSDPANSVPLAKYEHRVNATFGPGGSGELQVVGNQADVFADSANLGNPTRQQGLYIFEVALTPVVGPPLTIKKVGNQAVVSWPTNATGFSLQVTSNLTAPVNWQEATTVPAVVGDQNVVVEELASPSRFYRLLQR